MILIIIIIILYFILFYFNLQEDFEASIYDSKNNKCCLIKKVFTNDFGYEYTEYTGDKCNPDLYQQNNDSQLFVDGINNWSNDNCYAGNSIIGSCRNVNKECIDFRRHEDCKPYNLKWVRRTCHNTLQESYPRLKPRFDSNISVSNDNNSKKTLSNQVLPDPNRKEQHIGNVWLWK